ncbi:uncharacterized protein LOC117602401 [Osmia lignaria lignaria]|uniref:uncharacterized protein LOC117602401 n=1 Tax=Osmia lignaria lignaria TaxID=1437193 RepID=UPI00147823F6|nr:uncharacterized protein LOC117602401 [Osmia lignaria]
MSNTSKDYGKLKDVSSHFTEETLKNILCTVHNGTEVNVLSWNFGQASAKGDNYLSTVNKIKVNGIVDGKEIQVSLVVKSLPQNIGRRNTYRSVDFFHNEIIFYTQVLPKLEEFVRDKEQSQILCVPRHFVSVMDGKNDYITLEDVTTLGYKSIDRQNCLDQNQCMMILKTIAKFHATSFACKDQRKEEFMKAIENLDETYFSMNHWDWYKRFYERLVGIAKNALAMEYPGSEAEKKFNSYKFDELFEKAAEFCNRKYHATSVIIQGDCWVPNFMTRKTNENEALMLDFQLTRCASPVLDISTFIYACTDKIVWKTQFDELLKFYHNELCKTIKLLGSNPENIYPWSTFMEEVKEQFLFGLVFATEIIPMSLLDESDIFDLDAIKDDTAVDIADIWTLSNIKSKSGRLRLADVIVHAVQKGFL